MLDQARVSSLATFILLISVFLSDCTMEVDEDLLVEREGLMYLVGTDEPFTGKAFYNRGEISYKNGVQHGLEIYNYDNGKKIEQVFKNGKAHGKDRMWYSSGQLKFEKVYKNDELHGLSRGWYEDGQLKFERTYENYKKHGLSREWYEDGQIESEETYNEDKLQGLSREWYEDGQITAEITYNAGKEDGLSRRWYKTGRILTKATYTDGKLDSPEKVWRANSEYDSTLVFIEKFRGTFWGEGQRRQNWPSSVAQDIEGNLLIAGWTDSYKTGNRDIWLIKTNAEGDKEWDKTYGGKGEDRAEALQSTKDGGHIISGSTTLFSGRDEYLYLVKIDSDGGEMWDRVVTSSLSLGRSIRYTSDGGFIITGDSKGNDRYALGLMKTDEKGRKLWSKTLGIQTWSRGMEALETADSGYVVIGTKSNLAGGLVNSHDIWLIKTNMSGEVEWEKTFGGQLREAGKSITQSADNGFVLLALAKSEDDRRFTIKVMKTDSLGNEVWERTIEKENGCQPFEIQSTSDNGFIVVGKAGRKEGNALVIKLNSSGVVLWEREYLNLDSEQCGTSIKQIASGEYIIVGTNETELSASCPRKGWFLLKVDSLGYPVQYKPKESKEGYE